MYTKWFQLVRQVWKNIYSLAMSKGSPRNNHFHKHWKTSNASIVPKQAFKRFILFKNWRSERAKIAILWIGAERLLKCLASRTEGRLVWHRCNFSWNINSTAYTGCRNTLLAHATSIKNKTHHWKYNIFIFSVFFTRVTTLYNNEAVQRTVFSYGETSIWLWFPNLECSRTMSVFLVP